jgi:uncharacterized protein YoxC
MEHIIASYIIPAIAITMSVLFWINGRDSAKKAEQLLDEVTKTTRGWQNDIMKSTNQMLSSRPEIAAHSMYVAKIEAAAKLTESIQTVTKNIIENPKVGEEAKIQYASLKMLLDYQIHYFKFIVDGKDLPPKMSAELENMLKGILPQSPEKEHQEKKE